MKKISVDKKEITIVPNMNRVMLRPFRIDKDRTHGLVKRILALSEEEAQTKYESVLEEFDHRHRRFEETVLINYDRIRQVVGLETEPSRAHQLLIGSFFTHEYSIEAAALFNPSVVWHPDQSGVPEGSKRFALSLRATGEGHISSIIFRTGIFDEQGNVTIDEDSEFSTAPIQYNEVRLSRKFIIKKVAEIGLGELTNDPLIEQLPERFTLGELKGLVQSDSRFEDHVMLSTALVSLLSANYEMVFAEDTSLSERVIFPYAAREMNGMEDARFVELEDEDGTSRYYATYTAYSGMLIFPQLLETDDFITFRVRTLAGKGAQNKGMALFPRRINGQYAMLGRQDGENIYIMFSDDLYIWRESQLLIEPQQTWEFIQMGNCGSPIETPDGWLVLSHGVGPMRKYCLGIFLLDLHDPTRVIGRLPYPLMYAEGEEREGYVPNVVYTCGALCLGNQLFIPYAKSDYSTGFATVSVSELLAAMIGTREVISNK
ncbi:putative GH43/DUF377 family glycosyl hydrolase [Rhabdobacter roseus]|uniref:Putative GH43/DUF377 family glycosyl hydrolase n=1 Tax=Rhabdobacter roseus TaxID=1655419 RepID=A0A840TZ05_9BACT|nr:putative GH43/DUF377 family glycosyl hydrolase [Rhabdobacter roseus]